MNLKRKVSRLRDWNFNPLIFCVAPHTSLKRKVSRLRDWNAMCLKPYTHPLRTWNEKYLDYEIETDVLSTVDYVKDVIRLETKSISITRLKLHILFDTRTPASLAWNEKYLDYEIETCSAFPTSTPRNFLKRQVPRLRDWNSSALTLSQLQSSSLKRQVPRLRDWNSVEALNPQPDGM